MKLDTAFLDRDGTINVKAPKPEYILSPGALKLMPGAARAVRMLNAASVRVVVLTNQRCVALDLISQSGVDAVNARLRELLAAEEAYLNAIYVCPHGNGDCSCRKPEPGLFRRAVDDDSAIDLTRSVMIGDSESDVDAAFAAGVRPIRLGRPPVITRAPVVANDLLSAVRRLLTGPYTHGHSVILPGHPGQGGSY